MIFAQSVSRALIVSIGICVFSASGFSQEVAATQKTAFLVGGIHVALPAPGSEFTEVGDELRSTVFELFVPTSNRLVSAYALSKELPLTSTPANAPLIYAMVEVPRRAEYWNCTSEEFVRAVGQIMEQMAESAGGMPSDIKQETQDEINHTLKSLDLGKMDVGKTKMLGRFFSKTDADGLGMIAAVKYGNQLNTIAMSMALLRLKEKVLFAYLYVPYKDANTILWLKHASESWADALLDQISC